MRDINGMTLSVGSQARQHWACTKGVCDMKTVTFGAITSIGVRADPVQEGGVEAARQTHQETASPGTRLRGQFLAQFLKEKFQ